MLHDNKNYINAKFKITILVVHHLKIKMIGSKLQIIFVIAAVSTISAKSIQKRDTNCDNNCPTCCVTQTCCTTQTCNCQSSSCNNQNNCNNNNCNNNNCNNKNCNNNNCNNNNCNNNNCNNNNCNNNNCKNCQSNNNCNNNQVCQNDCKPNEVDPLKSTPSTPLFIDILPNITSINNNNINLTTHINIDNVVHNYNNISIPVYINTTNINNINITSVNEETSSEWSDEVLTTPKYTTTPTTRTTSKRPPSPKPEENEEIDTVHCHYQNIRKVCHEYPTRKCTIYRRKVCNNNNSQSQEDYDYNNYEESGYDLSNCVYTERTPYPSCNNGMNCRNCFECGGRYNPNYCSYQPRCNQLCRQIIKGCKGGTQCV